MMTVSWFTLFGSGTVSCLQSQSCTRCKLYLVTWCSLSINFKCKTTRIIADGQLKKIVREIFYICAKNIFVELHI